MISNQVDKQSYIGNGSNQSFSIPFTVLVSDQAEVGVLLRDITIPLSPVDTLQSYGSQYTLTGGVLNGPPFNTTVVMTTAPASNQILVIYRIFPFTQILNMVTSGTFDFSNINLALDRIVGMVQVLNEICSRQPLLAQATQNTQPLFPEPQASVAWGWGADKKTITYFSTTSIANAMQSLTGDVTSAGGTAAPTVIAAGAVTLAKIAAAAYASIPTASVLALFDANKNLSANNLLEGFTSTATAAGTTTLLVTSTYIQVFTGVTTQTVKLPTTGVAAGTQFLIRNRSTGIITIQSSNTNVIQALNPGSDLVVVALIATPVTSANWDATYSQPATDWVAYTPVFTGMGVVTAISFWRKVIGDSLYIRGTFTTGTVTAALAQASLPAGFTAKASKMAANFELVAYMSEAATNSVSFTVCAIPGGTNLVFDYNSDTNGGLSTGALGNVVFGSNATYGFSTSGIPIV